MARGIHPAPMARPLSRGLWDLGCHTLNFIRLGGSILRRRRGPFLGAYGLGVFHIGFQDATRIHPAPMARPFSKGLRDWGCHALDFIRLRGSILRRWRGPSLGAYGLGVSHIGFYTVTGLHPAPMARPFSKGLRFWGSHWLSGCYEDPFCTDGVAPL